MAVLGDQNWKLLFHFGRCVRVTHVDNRKGGIAGECRTRRSRRYVVGEPCQIKVQVEIKGRGAALYFYFQRFLSAQGCCDRFSARKRTLYTQRMCAVRKLVLCC